MNNLLGKRFESLVVTALAITPNRRYWKCLCDCGNETVVRGSHLIDGSIKSCGCRRGKNRLNFGESSRNSLYLSYKRNALDRGKIFELSKEEFIELTESNCYYCGQEPNQVRKKGSRHFGYYLHNGIDRVDNSKGYTIDNCVPCCKDCNRGKWEMDEKEFKQWITKVYNNYAKNQ